MNWLNLKISIIRSPEVVGSSTAEVGTWLLALAYCCEQENNGRIKSAKSWKTRQLQRAVGITHKEVSAAFRLLKWDGDDLVVLFYPNEKQAEVEAKRAAGRATADRRWKKQANSSATNSADAEVEVEVEREVEVNNNNKTLYWDYEKRSWSAPIPAEFIDRLAAAAPAVNYNTEMARIEAWIIANPNNRKKNWLRFITNWFMRAQERARPAVTRSSIYRQL